MAYKEQARNWPRMMPTPSMNLGFFYNVMGRHGEGFRAAGESKPARSEPRSFYGHWLRYLRGTEFEKSISYFEGAHQD